MAIHIAPHYYKLVQIEGYEKFTQLIEILYIQLEVIPRQVMQHHYTVKIRPAIDILTHSKSETDDKNLLRRTEPKTFFNSTKNCPPRQYEALYSMFDTTKTLLLLYAYKFS